MNAENENIDRKRKTLRENLSLLSNELTQLHEEKFLILHRYYDTIVQKDLPFKEVAKLLRTAFWEKQKEAYRQNRSDTVKEKLIAASLLSTCYAANDLNEVYESPQTVGETMQLAYLTSNRYSYRAMEHFSSHVSCSLQAVAVDSFSEICELVSSATCDFGILPIENSADGRLIGFYKMLDKYELKICAVCDIEDELGETFTRFALVARTLVHLNSDNQRWIELSATSSNASRILELIAVAELWGLSIKRLSSVPLSYRGNASVDTITLAVPNNLALSFFIYLHLFGKDINILGWFTLM